jgi:ATP-binding cassette, subfamily C (CFTR/MRP), member 1
MVLSNLVEALVSTKRLSEFLKAEEMQPDARVVLAVKDLKAGDEVLSINKADFTWSKEATNPTLEDISLTVKKGELVGVLGKVGSGKVSAFCEGHCLKSDLYFRQA